MKRLLATLGVAVVLALGVTVVLPPSVANASISPLAPDPINILPSVVKAGTKGNAAQTYAMWNSIMINVLQQAQKSKTFWNASANVKAGTATVTEAQWLASQVKKINVPAFKPQTLVKGAGGAAAAFFAFDMGYSIGDGVLAAFGVDKAGMVCSESATAGEWLAFIGGADCTEFKKNAEFAANLGLVAGVSGGWACDPLQINNCMRLVKQGQTDPNGYTFYCFEHKPSRDHNAGLVRVNTTTLSNFSPPNAAQVASNISTVCPGFTYAPGKGDYPNPTQVWLGLYGPLGHGSLTSYWLGNSPTPTPVESTGSNPDRTFKCVILGMNNQTYSASTASFKETDSVIPQPKCPDLPNGVLPKKITITEEGGGETHIVYEQEMTPESKDWATTYPECAQGTCMLDLLKNGKSCFVSPAACEGWLSDPTKETTYQCKYGGKVVALSECNVYGPSFDGDPKVTGHPDTGQPFGNPKPDPKDPKVFETPVQDPTKTRQCFPQGWSVLNPVEWVVKPVMCALEWAFVPRPATISALNNGLKDNVSASILGNAQTFLTAFAAPFQQSAGNCQGPPFKVQMDLGPKSKMNETYYPLNSCQGVMSTLAFFSYTVSGGIIYLGASLAAIKYFASIFGFAGMGARALDGGGSSSKVQFKANA